MKLFLHTITKVRIVNGDLEWQGTPAAFLVLEPEYPGLPFGATVRYQTDDVQYYEDGDGRHTDTVNCLGYCEGSYVTPPAQELTLPAIDTRIAALEAGGGSGGNIPIGCEMSWPFATAPLGWMLAQGGTVLRSSVYGTLLVNAGCPYGIGDGSTTVHVPDRRGVFLLGASATYALYTSGGLATHTLTRSELPTDVPRIPTVPYYATSYNGGIPHTLVGLVDNTPTASGQSFAILPPYQTTNIIIYVGEL